MELTDEIINELISCDKKITTPPKKSFYADKGTHKFLRNDFSCKNNKGLEFDVFMRKHMDKTELFSLGLVFIDKETSIKTHLLRVNGKHNHTNHENKQSFCDFHVHKANENQITKKIDNSFDAEISKDYMSFSGAFIYFCKICGIIDYSKYLQQLCQISMEEIFNESNIPNS